MYAQRCAGCHGPNATGTALHRGLIPLGNAKPVKIAYSLVPYATTVWDFINRAMPSTKPGSLTADEVYAVTAYVLYRNDIVKETDVLDARSLPKDPHAESRQLRSCAAGMETGRETAVRQLPLIGILQGVTLMKRSVPASSSARSWPSRPTIAGVHLVQAQTRRRRDMRSTSTGRSLFPTAGCWADWAEPASTRRTTCSSSTGRTCSRAN